MTVVRRTPDAHDFPTRSYDLVKEFVVALIVVAVLTTVLAAVFSSPDEKPITLSGWARQAPNDVVATAAGELAGTTTSAEYGPPYNNAASGQVLGPVELQKWAGMRHARDSVLNFGMPAYSGVTLSSLDGATIERSVAQAIRVFEPRINADSLSVDVKLERQDSRQNTLQIVIRGQLWSQPVPLELLLAADLDVETGHTRVRELK